MPTPDYRRVDEVKILQGSWTDQSRNTWQVGDYRAVVELAEGGTQTHLFEVLAAGRVGLLSARIIGVEQNRIFWSDGDSWTRVMAPHPDGFEPERATVEFERLHAIINEKDQIINDLKEQLARHTNPHIRSTLVHTPAPPQMASNPSEYSTRPFTSAVAAIPRSSQLERKPSAFPTPPLAIEQQKTQHEQVARPGSAVPPAPEESTFNPSSTLSPIEQRRFKMGLLAQQ